MIVGTGQGTFDPKKDEAKFNFQNPTRRDVAVLPRKGWIAIRYVVISECVFFQGYHRTMLNSVYLQIYSRQSWSMGVALPHGCKLRYLCKCAMRHVKSDVLLIVAFGSRAFYAVPESTR
jgi:hypothetical protein